MRKLPDTGEVVRSALKPIGEVYTSTAIDTNKDQIITATVEPANEEGSRAPSPSWAARTGNCGWRLCAMRVCWLTVPSPWPTPYIGTDLTWPIYWHGTLGRAKEDLDRAATTRSVAIWLPGAARGRPSNPL